MCSPNEMKKREGNNDLGRRSEGEEKGRGRVTLPLTFIPRKMSEEI